MKKSKDYDIFDSFKIKVENQDNFLLDIQNYSNKKNQIFITKFYNIQPKAEKLSTATSENYGKCYKSNNVMKFPKSQNKNYFNFKNEFNQKEHVKKDNNLSFQTGILYEPTITHKIYKSKDSDKHSCFQKEFTKTKTKKYDDEKYELFDLDKHKSKAEKSLHNIEKINEEKNSLELIKNMSSNELNNYIEKLINQFRIDSKLVTTDKNNKDINIPEIIKEEDIEEDIKEEFEKIYEKNRSKANDLLNTVNADAKNDQFSEESAAFINFTHSYELDDSTSDTISAYDSDILKSQL